MPAEAIGAGAASGLISILGDPARAATLPVASWIYPHLPSHDGRAVILAFTLLVMAFCIARNALLTVVTWVQLGLRPVAHEERHRVAPGDEPEDSTIVTCLDSPPSLLR